MCLNGLKNKKIIISKNTDKNTNNKICFKK